MLKANLFFGKKHFELVVKFNELTNHINDLIQVAKTIENPSDHDKISSLIVAKIEEQHWLSKVMAEARAEYIEANKPSDVCPF